MANIKLNLYKSDEIQDTYTFGELLEFMQEEMKHYEQLGKLEGLLNSSVTLDILDKNGAILSSKMNFTAGYLEGEIFHLQGALDYVSEGVVNEE